MNQLTTQLQQKEQTAQLIWTGFILSFFVIQAIIWIVAITFTVNDQSHAVVAGYDEKALNWDQEKALRVASQQLGWVAELLVDPASDIRGNHVFTLTLHDGSGEPVADANIDLEAFHRGRAGQRQDISLAEIHAGVYTGKIQVQKSGQWQFTGAAHRADATLLIEERQFLKANR